MIVNFIETMINILVPDKRQPNTISFLSPLSKQIQLNNDMLFNNYKISNTNYTVWSATTTYNFKDIVKYGKQLYYSTINNNIGVYPGNVGWEIIANNFIGADDRVHFDGTKLLFEYAINTYFGTIYQPNTTINSEIYTITSPSQVKSFIVGATEQGSDKVMYSNSTGNIKLSDNPISNYTLTIYVKGLNTVGKPTTGEIKNFADKYIVAGIIYQIVGY